eukprot:scaffold6077_cov80-Skeletonema_dohrnii-CCMP3373.AAC.2
MAGSLRSGLLRFRRRGNVGASSSAPPLKPTSSSTSGSSSLEKLSTISSFVGVMVMLAVVLLLAINHKISAIRHITAAKSLRRVRHSFVKRYPQTVAISTSSPKILTDMPYTIDFELDSIDSSDLTEPYFPDLVKGYNMDVCKPKHDWQSKSFPNCNMFHEKHLSEMSFITSGTLRS